MTWEIPNYDSIVGRAARLAEGSPATAALAPFEPTAAAPPPASAKDDWDPNKIELDMDELEEALSSRR